ncbi:MAG TPA: U32 family peptidase [Streptosporangiaceae bacterium]|jgi:hypothetical protein
MNGSDPSTSAQLLAKLGLPPQDPVPAPRSALRFADGSAYRFEIPSTEGPACLSAALAAAADLDVPVHRFSQGSGVFMLTDAELDAMAGTAAEAGVELSLFARPAAGWDTSATAVAASGGALFSAARGTSQLRYVLDDIVRAAGHGIRSVLIADLGVLASFSRLRELGDLPASMQAKVSVMLPAANPATARILVEHGANTLNLPPDLSISQIAAIRAVVPVPIDMYIEAPDGLGGFVRHHETAELIAAAAPVYVKLGLRNAPDIYPSGTHLEPTAIALSRERVRRARLVLELLRRSGVPAPLTGTKPPDLAVPEPA